MRGVNRSRSVDGLQGKADVVLIPVVGTEHVTVQVWIGDVHSVIMMSDLLNALNLSVIDTATP